jgi:restriction system protein
MLPLLRATADGADHRIADLIEQIAAELHLTPEERDQQLQSGQRVIFNRSHWAVTYLAKAVVLERSARGTVRITERGRQLLAEKPSKIDVKRLSSFPEFVAFRTRTASASPEPLEHAASQTPDELLDSIYAVQRRSVEADLLDHVLSGGPDFFEQLVVDLLVAMGYGGADPGASRRVGKSGDDGIDGVIDEDKLGLDAVYIQAKRWDPKRPVSRPDLQAFAGSLQGQRATKGVFITTSRFTEEAREYVGRIPSRIVLIDGLTLARLLYDYGIGVRDYRQYLVRKVDTAYFEGDV